MKLKGGQNWTPITPLTGSVLHAETQITRHARRSLIP
jgi:hypothetical protein